MDFSGILRFINRLFGNWGASVNIPLDSGFTKFNIKTGGFRPSWIIVHHSWSADHAIGRDWEGIRKFHMSWRYNGDIVTEARAKELEAEGKTVVAPWKDVGYNFGIEKVDGKLQILDGRAVGEVGAHAKGFNERSVGICLIGNFDKEPPSADLIFVLCSLIRDLQRVFKIPRDQVLGHRETFVKLNQPVEKTCPGTAFDLNALRAKLIDPA